MIKPAKQPLERSLTRSAYWDDAFFQREREGIFWREWFVAGRASQWKEPGSYRVVDVAGESVIVVRDEAGRFHGHLNFCRHRGSRLLCGEGALRGAIRCPYHSWAYALDGALIASPFVERDELEPGMERLHPVAIEQWGGFVFVNVGGALHTLADQLGPIAQRVVRYPLDELAVGHSIRYDVDANWKVLLENYNECYHCAPVHPELCRVVPAFKQRGGAQLDWENGIPHREGAWTFTHSGTTARSPFPGLDEFERVRHKGELVYPNLLLSLSADHVTAFYVWPQSPSNTVIVCDFLFHPDEMAKPDFDPADAVDFWDITNRQDWHICAEVQAGMRSQAFRYGHYAPMEDLNLDIRRYVAERIGSDAVVPRDDA